MVGGGPRMNESEYPTVVEGRVVRGKLQLTVHNILTGKVLDTFTFNRS